MTTHLEQVSALRIIFTVREGERWREKKSKGGKWREREEEEEKNIVHTVR